MNLNRRNYPPEHGIRVPFLDLRQLLARLFEAVDMDPADAALLADILTRNNRRCLYSHGTGQVPYYLEKIRGGEVNPRPEVKVVSEADASLVMDGDGGLGYFPCYRGTERLIEKAKAGGIAALTTRNHQHVGSAGNYTRLALEHDCIGIATSAHRGYPDADGLIFDLVKAVPISIAVPAKEQPPVVMDMGTALIGFDEDLFRRLPTNFFKVLALSTAVHSLGAIFAGAHKEEFAARASQWESNQGSFIAVVDVNHFMPVDELKEEMDRFVHAARQMRPLPEMERPELPGGNEWHWERENAELGIPMSDEHVETLRTEAERVGIDVPFSKFEGTRF